MTTIPEPSAAPQAPASRAARGVVVAAVVALLACGLAWAGSQGGVRVGPVPLFAALVGWIFAVQLVGFAHAWARQTEAYFDLLGSLTYLSTIVAGLLLSGHTDPTAWLLTLAVVVWAARLGSFLFTRVRRAGRDDRFDAIKPDFGRFLSVWLLQGLWVTLTLGAALAAVTALERPAVGVLTVVGLLVWAAGFAVEVVADAQKSRFRADPAHRDVFISTGLWAWSRHPNYFGEIVLWLGIALAALPALQGWQYATLVSPVFVAILLGRVSGVPLLERKADARWGDRADYRAYRAATPVLVPRPPRRR